MCAAIISLPLWAIWISLSWIYDVIETSLRIGRKYYLLKYSWSNLVLKLLWNWWRITVDFIVRRTFDNVEVAVSLKVNWGAVKFGVIEKQLPSALQDQMCYFAEINVKTREKKKRKKRQENHYMAHYK